MYTREVSVQLTIYKNTQSDLCLFFEKIDWLSAHVSEHHITPVSDDLYEDSFSVSLLHYFIS